MPPEIDEPKSDATNTEADSDINRDNPEAESSEAPAREGPRRRSFMWGFLTVVIGAVIGLGPVVAGLAMALDPIWRRLKRSSNDESTEEDDGPGTWIRIASVDAVPANGLPARFPVLADLVDAWNRVPNQPIGAIYMRRDESGGVQAFNAVCPHAGCFVAFSDEKDAFHCPCHNSAFAKDGSKVELGGKANPSPRPLDELKVDNEKLAETGDVWVKFVNYYPAKHEQVPKT